MQWEWDFAHCGAGGGGGGVCGWVPDVGQNSNLGAGRGAVGIDAHQAAKLGLQGSHEAPEGV